MRNTFCSENINSIDEDDESAFDKDNRSLQLNEPVDCTGLINKIKQALSVAMGHYWKDLSDPKFILFSLLDPRIKRLSFLSTSERYAAEDLLRVKYREMKSNMETKIVNIEENKQNQKKASTILASLKKPIPSACADEVTEYLPLEEIDLESNPFTWWKERKEKFPILSQFAMKYLSVYTVTTSSEKLFSDANNLLVNKETAEIFKYLIFLKQNNNNLN